MPVYIQEKVHPQALVENLRDTAKPEELEPELTLFADFNGMEDSAFDKKVDFYHHDQHWSNRMILGDSLLVMTSLAEKEGLKGKVQTIYFDPPYGIKFASNWQVSTRKRDVKDGKVEDATRWITIDTSRVALALARTRLMGAKYPYFLLADSPEGVKKEAEVTGKIPPEYKTDHDIRKGFVYKRVPHVTLKSIANNPDIEEGMTRQEIDAAIQRHAATGLLYDKPYEDPKRIRVFGPFTVESLSPFAPPETGRIAVKAINHYGDEVLKVFELETQV